MEYCNGKTAEHNIATLNFLFQYIRNNVKEKYFIEHTIEVKWHFIDKFSVKENYVIVMSDEFSLDS